MWQKIKDLKEKSKNKYIKAGIFFGFYFIFFIIIFLLSAGTNEIKEDNSNKLLIKDKWQLINNNYQFLYEIKIEEDQNELIIVKLEGKKYHNKELIDKYINNQFAASIYIYYDEIKVKENDVWQKEDDFHLVDPFFNYNLIDINYFKKIAKTSTLINKITNFDESIEEHYLYYLNDEEVIYFKVLSKNNLITDIDIDYSLMKIKLQYKNIDKITDFVIN